MTYTKLICALLFWAYLPVSLGGVYLQAQELYIAEEALITNIEKIHVTKQEDANLQPKGIIYTIDKKLITNVNTKLHAQVIEIPEFESNMQKQVSHLHQKRKQTKKPDKKVKKQEQRRVLPFLWSYCQDLPAKFVSSYYLGRAISSSTTSVPPQHKIFHSKIYNFYAIINYRFSNPALYNQQLAQQPVSSYSIELVHYVTNLPPPKAS